MRPIELAPNKVEKLYELEINSDEFTVKDKNITVNNRQISEWERQTLLLTGATFGVGELFVETVSGVVQLAGTFVGSAINQISGGEYFSDAHDNLGGIVNAGVELFSQEYILDSVFDSYERRFDQAYRLTDTDPFAAGRLYGKTAGEIAASVVEAPAIVGNIARTTTKLANSALENVSVQSKISSQIGAVNLSKGIGSSTVPNSAHTGLRTKTVVSAERAEQFLVKHDVNPEIAKSYIKEFDGDITARLIRPGEDFLRYFDAPKDQGSFLTKTIFDDSSAAVNGLNLGPYGNKATLVQPVTSRGRTIVLEGAVKNGGESVKQFYIYDRSIFEFGKGSKY